MHHVIMQAGAAVDLALLLCGTVSHLLSNDDAAAAFASAAASLADRGVCVVEMAHPVDLFSGVLECGDTWEVGQAVVGCKHRVIRPSGSLDTCSLRCSAQTPPVLVTG